MRDTLPPDYRHQMLRAAELKAYPSPEKGHEKNQAATWEPSDLTGRLCELRSDPQGVHLTIACSIICDFQNLLEPTAWVTNRHNTFFPPDAARTGVDLSALPVIQVHDLRAVITAVEHLIRSGAFGLILMELNVGMSISTSVLWRLARLARQNHTALLCLTFPGIELGSMVSIRGVGTRHATLIPDHFRYDIHVTKDRQRSPGQSLTTTYCAPHGVC